jgi:hypothetical protein
VALLDQIFSDEFWKSYHAAITAEAPTIGAAQTKPGSMSAMIVGYYGSGEFKTLADSTKQNYRRILEDFVANMATPVASLTRGYRTWTEADIAAFRKYWPGESPQRIAMELLLHIGLRRSDIVRLGPSNAVGDSFQVPIEKIARHI